MQPPPPPPSRARAVVPRVVGNWILAGCLLKALLGTPADLPLLIQRAPLPLGTTFALVLGIEAFVGVATILRPGRAWPLATLLLTAFVAVLAVQMAEGKGSCGCFGATIDVPVWAMLAVDGLLLALLVGVRPWRLPKGGAADLAALGLALLIGAAVPVLSDRESTASQARPGDWVPLSVRDWKGRRLQDTDLGFFAAQAGAGDGVWILYRDSCPVCAGCLRTLAMSEQRGQRELVLVRLPEDEGGQHPAAHELPEGPYVTTIRLPEGIRFVATAPARLVVEEGLIVEAGDGVEADACRW